ncbi:gfo/Idh/MocA family oxidoreductase [Actinomadura logoneensis]|uniref:Gfo/Idh/MocA family oxidoreductase n=1 Tax=Actinomadura logoneensis TaxID=2293572 RepID=A0A372J9T9_9ACTN|nr:Gfo/Idh/MocA family oxidoreductase [Actinomadura logoneensis]RFU36757.1 gfo/Idh/MocA family oxidoreductase [Actinomadura logoneensis]
MPAIRVGIIGANPDQGWASRAHIPALRALPGYEITAVGTRREESAREAARRFGVPHHFTDPRELAAHPDVDLVAITVKVPAHDELIRAALGAGRQVFSEWPLTRTTDEAEAVVKLAAGAGVRTAVGLQARFSPAAAHARALLADGYAGRVTSVNVHGALAKGANGTMPAWSSYTADVRNAAGTLEVGGGHHLDLVQHLAGPVAELSASLAVQRVHYTVAETGEPVEADSPDQVAVAGTLASGATLSAHIHYAKRTAPGTRIEIAGTEGDLTLLSRGGAGLQIDELVLLGNREPGAEPQRIDPPAALKPLPPALEGTEAANVARIYQAFADSPGSVPTFEDALDLHRLLDAVRESAASGRRVTLSGRDRAA